MKDGQYTAADFDRYHSGKMSPQEMHELEKAALDDPFLGDALEGYRHSKYPQEEVRLIRERLRRKIPPKETAFRIWKVAAILVLFLSAGFWFIQNSKEDGAEIALTEAEKDTPAIARYEEPEPVAKEPVKRAASPAKKNTKPGKKTEAELPALASKIDDGMLDTPVQKNKEIARINPIGDTLSMNVTAKAEETVDSTGQSAAAVAFLRETAPGARAGQKPALLRAPDTSQALRKLLRLPESENFSVRNPFPEPEGGWDLFNRYLVKNKPNLKQKGSVTLDFVISLTGYPTRIVVVHSTCEACERAAVVLLRDGPKWKNSHDGRGEVTILF